MTRFSRLLPCVAVACSMTVSSLMAQTAPAPAATAPAAAPAPATQPAVSIPENQNLRDDVDDFWHYGKVARYDMATAFGNKLLSRPEPPLQMLQMFETTAAEHQDSLDDWMLRWQGSDNPQMAEVARKVEKVLDAGRHERRAEPKFIEANIKGLAVSERGYANHLAQLRDSGELAVPIMIDDLRDAGHAEYHDVITRALKDMGRSALNPLLTATETKDNALLLTIISVLGDVRYDAPIPFLARISQDQSRPADTRKAAVQALQKIGASVNGSAINGATASDLFYRLGEKLYYNNSDISADPRGALAYIWYWDDQKGLNYKSVPPPIFGDLMAMRCCRIALELGPGSGDSLALWLAANNKAEVDLPEGASPVVFPKDRPSANYYNVYAGAQYLNAVLSRSMADHNSAVALKVIKSLEEIVGPGRQGMGQSGNSPLVQAMQYPDRLVRYEAAFALASGQATQPFPGRERVAPLLAEAVAQTGSANLLIIAPSQGDITKLSQELKGYGVAGGENAQAAIANASSLPWIDVIVISENLGDAQVSQAYQLAGQSPRLERVGKVILAKTQASPWFQRTINDPLTVVTASTDTAGIQKAIEDARQKAGGNGLDEKTATSYAMRAATLLQRLAEARTQVYELSTTRTQLLASLNDKRPEIVKAVADALAYMDSDQIQPSLLSRGLDDKTPDDEKVALLQSLAKNAKFHGNRLDESQIGDLQKAVESAQNLEVRTAAAEARGALNLPADQAKALIVKEGTP